MSIFERKAALLLTFPQFFFSVKLQGAAYKRKHAKMLVLQLRLLQHLEFAHLVNPRTFEDFSCLFLNPDQPLSHCPLVSKVVNCMLLRSLVLEEEGSALHSHVILKKSFNTSRELLGVVQISHIFPIRIFLKKIN